MPINDLNLIPTILLVRDGHVCGCILTLTEAIGMTEKDAKEYCAAKGFSAQFQDYWGQVNG